MRRTTALAALAAGCLASPTIAQDLRVGPTSIDWGGYVKLDALYSRFSEGEVAQGGGRDFYLPNAIPVSAGGGDSYEVLDMHAKETRLFIRSTTALDGGHKLGTHIEFDFIVNQGAGNEVVTNAYNPGLRRAFVTFDNWLLGQEWSTFQNLGALPETLDFVAFPSEGTVFSRQPMIRYTMGGLQLALENATTTVPTPASAGPPPVGASIGATNDNRMPDVVARYNLKMAGMELVLAALARELRIDNGAVEDNAVGGGVLLSGKIGFGADDLKFMFAGGDGLGRYLALGTSADAVLDADGDLEPIGVTAGYVAYKHAWTAQLRSTVTASAFIADNDTALTGTDITETVRSASVNLLYSPVPKLTYGGEFRHAERELEDGRDGKLDRFQFSVKYSF